MRKICSLTLALLLLVSAMFVVPATTAMAEDTVELYTSADFSEEFFGIENAMGIDGNSTATVSGVTIVDDPDVSTLEAHGKVAKVTTLRKNGDDTNPVQWTNTTRCAVNFVLPSSVAATKFQVKQGITYTIVFDAKIVSASYDVVVELLSNPADSYSSLANIRQGTEVQVISKSQSAWKTYTVEFTAENDGDLFFIIRSNSTQFTGEVYMDNVVAAANATVSYGDGTISVPSNSTYEAAVSKIPYATALYTDEAKTIPATGVIGKLETAVYPVFDYNTTIDFEEEIYEDSSDYSVCSSTLFVDDPDEATVADHGKVAKISGTGKLWAAPKWAPGVRFADKDGTGLYNIKSGVKYHITFDYKIDKSAIAFNVLLRATNTADIGNSLSEINKTTVYSATEAVTESTGWLKYDNNFTVYGDGYLMLCAMATDNTNDTTLELYIDNITVTPLSTVSYGNSSVNTNANTYYESLLLTPSVHTSWYLDEACTEPAIGQIGLTSPTLYSKYSAATSVDFDEAVYVNGTANSLGYATMANDADRGGIVKFAKLAAATEGDGADNWAHAVRIADATGSGYFAVEEGKQYTLTYDYKVASTGSTTLDKFGFCVQIIDGGLGDVYYDSSVNTAWKTNRTMPKGEDFVVGDWVNESTCTFTALKSGYVVLSLRGFNKWANDTGVVVYLDNVKIAQVMATAPSEAALFSTADTEANEAAGITGTEGSAVYTVGETEYAAFRVFGEYIAPANAEGNGADTTKIMKADGTTATIASRHMMLGYKTTPTLEANYAMSTAEGDALANYWSVTPNADGTYTVRYSLLLKNIPEAYQKTAFNARGAIVTAEGETIYTNTQVDISATVLYNKAVASNAGLVWFGGVAGAVE